MSEHNYAGLLFKANIEKHPEVFTINDETVADVEKRAKEQRAERDKLNPAMAGQHVETARQEYNRLAGQLFGLTQEAKSLEIRVNEAAGQILLLEKRIGDVLKSKKQYESDGNLLAARNAEHGIQQIENELAFAKANYEKQRAYNRAAARALKSFDKHERIAELKAILFGEGVPVPK
jgi:chromosome segregation ATPase